MLQSSLVCSSLWLATGCGSKDSVALSTRVTDPQLRVAPLALGSDLSGSFTLTLRLGQEAPSATEVELSQVALARGGIELRASLDAAADPALPLTLAPGDSTRVSFSVAEPELLAAADAEALCSGPLQLMVVVTDSLSEAKTTTAASPEFLPDCAE